MKIVELLIDELEDIMGFDAVALVHTPAHEADFYAFNTPDVEDAIAFQVIKTAFEELTQEDKDSLSQEFNYYDDLPSNVLERLLEKLGELGIPKSKLIDEGYEFYEEPQTFGLPSKSSANPDGPTSDVNGNNKILYEYTGPKDSKNRDFCRKLLDLDLLFRKEDIQKMSITGANSEEFGYYDIFSYKGSFGCRHNWRKKYVYQTKSDRLLETAGLLLDQNRDNFSKERFAVDDDHQLIVGPLMIPGKLIFRVNEDNEPYYVYFSRDTVVEIANKMMKDKRLDRMNIEHDPDSPVEGYMVESWIITDEEHDKSKSYGFDLPVGTWMGMYKIDSERHWEMVKDGKVKGMSIEGFFIDKLIQN